MNDFVQGQRWVVDSEPELGLGIVTESQGRVVTIFFPQANCERTYAIQQAPLTRIRFSEEDEIKTHEGEPHTVKAIHEESGIIIYEALDGTFVPETSLSSEIQLNQPFLRLMTGQLDKPLWFNFKRRLNHVISKLWQSRLNGLLGIRASLIPHQLFVAWQACEHQRVRILLADEVGLGKTIEAGMILSRLIKFQRVERALIVVPHALQVQWLIELVRRFSLHAEIYKEEEHDYSQGQIHIIPHDVLVNDNEDIIKSDFDIVVVDEAHHLTPDSQAFDHLSQLSEIVEHIVLLSATPEQLGIESHFARLNLLDPLKFSDFEQFLTQEKEYASLNDDIKALPGSRADIIKNYQLDLDDSADDEALINQLLDSHGVGRVVFRNVRSAIAGFPKRQVFPALLEGDEWEVRFEWLAQWLKENKNEKVLVICHHIDNVFACEDYLWKKHGLDAAVFHEQQDLIERDRAAAYFADEDDGAQVLICSEIGSEGRNFQFCSHLVCLDLPQHPDLLEQRIGRLDRIGQKYDVHVHIPYAENSETATRFTWCHEILNCIAEQNPAASSIHDKFWPQLDGSLNNNALIDQARQELTELKQSILEGRDALLERNSCRQPQANELKAAIEAFESDSPFELVELASDLMQFHFEETLSGVYSVIPSDKMLVPALPGLPPEGSEITFEREIANHREEVKFISWDAPFIQGLWDLLQYSELGSAGVATLPSKQLPAGHCLIEAAFDIVVQSEHAAVCRQFLPEINIRSLALDISDNDLSQALPEDALQGALQDVKKHLAKQIINSKKDEIPAWFKKCEQFSEIKLEETITKAISSAESYYNNEAQRLKNLNKRNKLDDSHEITLIEKTAAEVTAALKEQSQLHLSSVRLIVITD